MTIRPGVTTISSTFHYRLGSSGGATPLPSPHSDPCPLNCLHLPRRERQEAEPNQDMQVERIDPQGRSVCRQGFTSLSPEVQHDTEAEMHLTQSAPIRTEVAVNGIRVTLPQLG